MLGVPPAGAVSGDVLLRAFLESQRLGGVERGLGAFGPPGLDRVYAVVGEPPALRGLRAGLGQAECR